MTQASYTRVELMICSAARQLEDGAMVVVGTGAPCAAAMLAQKTAAPNLTLLFEAGGVGPQLPRMPVSVGDSRTFYRGLMATSMADIMQLGQRGMVEYTFLGGAQIDQFGNLNSTQIGSDYANPKVRLPGSGGANDLASFCWRVMVITPHDKRRFVETCDFVTTPGYLTGPGAREAAGLPPGTGPHKVITDLAVLGYDDATKRMQVESLHPGVTLDEVRDRTGFELLLRVPLDTTPRAAPRLARRAAERSRSAALHHRARITLHTLLFDIDGTLLHSGGAGQAGIERALQIAFGVTAPTDGIPTAGRTDRGIATDLIRFHGMEESEANHVRLLEAYLRVLPGELAARQGVVYPGVRELLSRLSARADVRLGLLTGNYREAAWQKLRHYDLAHHFAFGGFGDEHPHRDDVARQALSAAEAHHAPHAIHRDRLWVIGDTPADVQCGRAIGARVIAVATGLYSAEALAAARPDHLFANFADVNAVLALWS